MPSKLDILNVKLAQTCLGRVNIWHHISPADTHPLGVNRKSKQNITIKSLSK